MSTVLKRTVFYDNTKNVVRFWDWALVTTTIGTMVEPFNVNMRWIPGAQQQNFDPEDEATRIDEMVCASIDKQQLILSGGNSYLHGGYVQPHVGR
jgi:hypothetical protein